MQVLYELVTVSGESKAINVTEKLGRQLWMKIRKSGDLPVYGVETFHRPRVIGRKPVYNESTILSEI